MSDDEVEGVWRYLDGTYLNWAKWATNNPNIKQMKKCAKLKTNGLFYEFDCTAASSSIYCEKYKGENMSTFSFINVDSLSCKKAL